MDFEKFKQEVLPLVRQTRDISFPHFGNIEYTAKKNESFDVVTELDIEVEEFLRENLAKIDETISFVGEETGGNRESSKFWLCDPIDGTGLFVRGIPFCTTMVALIENQVVTASVIYDFVKDEMYYAYRGEGAYKEGERLQVSDRYPDQAYFCWEINNEVVDNRTLISTLADKYVMYNSCNSGYEYAMIASGKIDGRICYYPYGFDYDFAPGSLLVEEAGGVVANVGKTTYDYRERNHLAMNKNCFQGLTEGPDALFPIKE